jgi:hypothetical protein
MLDRTSTESTCQIGKRPRTWLSLTEQGRKAFAAHAAALRAITETAGESPRS